jgi:putative oxidoreductase
MDPSIYILLSSMGAALALLGPGAWSVDARLFGWKRINIQDD